MGSRQEWGWDASFESQWLETEGERGLPARVIGGAREMFRVAIPDGQDAWATPSGRLRRGVSGDGGWPAVGDWVLLSAHGPDAPAGAAASTRTIVRVLGRRTWLARHAPDDRAGMQVLAANVDVACIVTSLNRELNPRRIERYLAMVHQGGVAPVLVLTKADLLADGEAPAVEPSSLAPGVPTLVVSALTGAGLPALSEYLAPGRTVVLVGSSGVGKSTLANALLGREAQAVREVRADDDRGRHTTTGRELFRLPGGAMLIDTPGLRELGLAEPDGALGAVFSDVEGLAGRCRFQDCRHESEPGCAVKAAVEAGALDAGRFEGYRKLRREAAFRAAEADPAEARKRKAQDKTLARLVKQVKDLKRK